MPDEAQPVSVRRGIQTRLAVLVLLSAVAPMVLLGWSSARSVSAMRDALLSERRAFVVSAARRVERDVRGMLEALSAVSPSQPDSLRAARLRSRLLADALVVNPAGGVVAAGPDLDPGVPGEVGRCMDLGAVVRAGAPAVCAPSASPGDGRRFVVVPLRDVTGRAAAAAVGIVDLHDAAWTALGAPAGLDPSAAAQLRDANGGLLAGRDPPGSDDDIAVAERLTVLPWTLSVVEPARQIFQPLRRLQRDWLFLAPSIAGVAVAYAWGVARSVKRPLAKLEAAAARIAAGDLSQPLPPLSDDEIGRLGRSFEAMRRALARDETRRRLLREVITAQEQERKRIARELHDETCQTISALKIKLDAAGMKDAQAMAGRCLDELHRIIHGLRPSVLDDLGLVSAIRWVATRDLVPLGIQVRFELEEPRARLPFEAEIAVFRAVQESIANIVRHARAETVLIEAVASEDVLEIDVEDDGDGFDPAQAAPSPSGRGLGLLGMHERLELIGGSFRVASAPGKGTRVSLRVPIPRGE